MNNSQPIEINHYALTKTQKIEYFEREKLKTNCDHQPKSEKI